MEKIIIFVDDIREPKNYIDCINNKVYCARTYNSFVLILDYLYKKYGYIDEIWFDHDLGNNSKSGYDCAKYLIDFCDKYNLTIPQYHIHSANAIGRQNIESYIKSYQKSLTL